MDLNKCFKYYDELYQDLQNIILSKVRNPQNKNLLEDITNYKISKICIFENYEKNDYDYNIDNEFYIYYAIENDLLRYFNDDVSTLYAITETNIEKLERILSIKNKMKLNKLIVTKLMNGNTITANSRINILLGALTLDERDDFINKFPISEYT
tara:strand:+ start:668 stop:1129 length:462 start_codon:yes stop_codon:yes gene_type:complete